MSDLLVDSLSIRAFAEGACNRDWTCAVAAAVFRFDVPTINDIAGASCPVPRPTQFRQAFWAPTGAIRRRLTALPAFRSTSAQLTAAAPGSGPLPSGWRAGC